MPSISKRVKIAGVWQKVILSQVRTRSTFLQVKDSPLKIDGQPTTFLAA